jgi:Septum formation
VAVVATVIVAVPSLTGYLTEDQLRPGDCLTGSNLGLGTDSDWPYLARAVPCSAQHLGEVFFAGNAWARSLAYPGDNAISDGAQARCLSAFLAYDGIDNSASDFSFDNIGPYGASDWASGDRRLVCVAHEGGPVDYSIKGSDR